MGDAPVSTVPKPCCVCYAPDGKDCSRCKSRQYCSKKCQLADWKEGGHKEQCKQLAAKFQDRLLDELMPPKKVKEEPPIVEDVLLADGSKARASAVRATAVVKAGGMKEDVPNWRGTCAICLDLVPIDGAGRTFYDCCCKSICTACSDECDQYDKRCPLCRASSSKSDAEAVRRVQKHVVEGNAEAQVHLAYAYHGGFMGLKKNSKRAFQLYERAAAQGHLYAHVALGRSFHYGDGVKIDYKTAAQWYRRAAERGYPGAQSKLGVMFHNGKGVAQSYGEAARWFGLAAAQGDTDALYNLGGCYANGKGVPKDLDEALSLYKRAAAQGSAKAAAAVCALQLEALRV